MKKLIRILAVISIAFMFSSVTLAQNAVKIGYIDMNTLVTAMPGVDSVKAKLQKYQQTLSDQLDAMRAEFENKYTDYQSQQAGMSDLIKQTKEKELQDLQGRIDAFQTKAQQDLQAKQQELLQPILDKAKAAIKDVAKENKYTLILNSIEDVVLYSETADDIMPLVKKKLGIGL
ncbi:MAG TPA: OmpH family outer membrane protein [Bacteroidales bacterium]|nr:OmpH family outer membrane protein [Bacteroidales bacterium]